MSRLLLSVQVYAENLSLREDFDAFLTCRVVLASLAYDVVATDRTTKRNCTFCAGFSCISCGTSRKAWPALRNGHIVYDFRLLPTNAPNCVFSVRFWVRLGGGKAAQPARARKEIQQESACTRDTFNPNMKKTLPIFFDLNSTKTRSFPYKPNPGTEPGGLNPKPYFLRWYQAY